MATYSVTFGIVTPESAKEGDYSETGFILEDRHFDGTVETAADLVVNHCGHCEASSSDTLTRHDWFIQADPEEDLSDGSETTHSVHFGGVTDRFMEALAAELERRGIL